MENKIRMKITNVSVNHKCLVFLMSDGGRAIYPLSSIVAINTDLSIDSVPPDFDKLTELRVNAIIEAEGEKISIVEIKGAIGRLEHAENCLHVIYDQRSHASVYYFSGLINKILNRIFL
jgi:hypothetical protein